MARSLYLIEVWYPRGGEGPSHELYTTRRSLAAAHNAARQISQRHQCEVSIDGAEWPTGGWDNPVYRSGNLVAGDPAPTT